MLTITSLQLAKYVYALVPLPYTCIDYEVAINFKKSHGFPISFVLWWATMSSTIENVWENHDFKAS